MFSASQAPGIIYLTKGYSSDYLRAVTVCIAAICENGQMIVSASDTMLSLADVAAADVGVIKGIRFYRQWIAMTAGDLGRTEPLLSRVGIVLAQQEKRARAEGHPEIAVNNAETIKAAFTRVYHEELRREIENVVLSRYDLTLDGFKQQGRSIFGDELMADICKQIEAIDLQCEFLVHGSDPTEPKRTARIFSIQSPGRVGGDFSRVGWWAIGSGGSIATTALAFNNYGRANSLRLALYRVCEAKFRAEAAGGVGRNTILAVSDISAQKYAWVGHQQTEEIRALIHQGTLGAQTLPSLLISIDAIIRSWQWQAL